MTTVTQSNLGDTYYDFRLSPGPATPSATRTTPQFNPTQLSLAGIPFKGDPAVLSCRALYAYEAGNTSELSFQKNHIILVLNQPPSGWWEGINVHTGVQGWFSSRHVTMLSDDEAEGLGLSQSGYSSDEAEEWPDSDSEPFDAGSWSTSKFWSPQADGQEAIKPIGLTMDGGPDIAVIDVATFIDEVKSQTSEAQALIVVENLLPDREFFADVYYRASTMGFALRDQATLLHKLNKILKKHDTQIVYPVEMNAGMVDLLVVTTSSRGEIFVNHSHDHSSRTDVVHDTETLRVLLLLVQEPWELLVLPSSAWASCVMELLQIEYRLFVNGQLPEAAFDPRYGRRCMRCLRRLANKHGVLPPSYMIHDIAVEGQHAVWGGAYADIWKGLSEGNSVCLKVIRLFTTVQVREDVIKAFCHEALVWKELNHPNVLPFLGVSTEVFAPLPNFCLISPWMANGNLIGYLENNPDHDRRKSVKEIVKGLDYLHAHDPPIVHGDIKGANILVSDDFRCCLADFGLAATIETQTLGTSSAGQKGTVPWMAPELFAPSDFLDCDPTMRDIYAFGCTVFEIYTGNPPFHNDRDIVVMRKVLASERPSPPPDKYFPDDIWDIVQLSWQHLPNLRPPGRQLLGLLSAD